MYSENVNETFSYLIDSGSDITILKKSALNGKIAINSDKKCSIRGVGQSNLLTLGEVVMPLKFEQKTIKHPVHIVQDTFPILTDAILGRDFLVKYKCKIDYDLWMLQLNIDDEKLDLPMHHTLPKNNRFILPARAEIIRPITLHLESDSVIFNQELAPGVFLANAILPCSGFKHVKIINTNDHPTALSTFKVSYSPLNQFGVHKSKSPTYDPAEVKRRGDVIEAALKKKMEKSPPEGRSSIIKACRDFHDIFLLEGDRLTANNFYEQKIELVDKTPVYRKNYRLPQAQAKEVREHIEKLIRDDLIEPAISPYNNPIFIVPKRSQDGGRSGSRLVVDMRGLNERIKADTFPLPNLNEILEQMGRSRWFSTIDLAQGFMQVPLHWKSRPYTAFSFPGLGSWQYKRLCYGLKIAPPSFCRFMRMALQNLEHICFQYIDDLCLFSCSINQHEKNLRILFQRLRDCNLKLNLEKCQFLLSEILYLGHVISDRGVRPSTRYHDILDKYPVPKDAPETLRFISFCSFYSKFIKDFAKIVFPLRQLLKKNTPFKWQSIHQNSFETLIRILQNPPVLRFPDYEKTFDLVTDSSDYSFGATILQDGHPVAYASRGLTPSEMKKPIIIKELLAAHWAIKHFRCILYGRHFRLFVDHRPLVSLFSQKDPSSKLTRIRLDLEEYDFEIQYLPGSKNLSDALSRIKLTSDDLKKMIPVNKEENETTEVLAVTRSMTKKAQEVCKKSENALTSESSPGTGHSRRAWNATSSSQIKHLDRLNFLCFENTSQPNLRDASTVEKEGTRIDVKLSVSDKSELQLAGVLEKLNTQFPHKTLALSLSDPVFKFVDVQSFKNIANEVLENVNIILFSEAKRIDDKDEQLKIIKQVHEGMLNSHCGVKRCIELIKQRFFWKSMHNMIKDYILRCPQCQLGKINKHVKEPLTQTDTEKTSFSCVELDLYGPMSLTLEGHRYALTFQDNLTKYVDVVAIPDKTADTVAKAIVQNFFLKYNFPKSIRTDMGTEFINSVLIEICKLLNIDKKHSTAVHHESISSLERNHRVMNSYFRTMQENKRSDWDQWIHYYAFSYNVTPHSVHNFTPFELIYGKLPRLPLLGHTPDAPVYNIDDYKNELVSKLLHAHEIAKTRLEDFKTRQNSKINENRVKTNFKVGSSVKLRCETTSKWQPPYKGPFKVIETNGVNTTIEKDGKRQIVHNNRLQVFHT